MAAVLLVDPNTATRRILRHALEERWHTVFEAADQYEALQVLERCPDPLVVVLNSRAQPVDGMQLLQAVATDPRLRLRHGYLVLSKEAGWLPPSFRLLEEVLHLRHLVPQDDIGALLPVVTQTVASMTHGLPDPGKTLPPRRSGRPSAPR